MKVVTQKKNPKLEMKVEQLLCLVTKYKQPFDKCKRHNKNLDRRSCCGKELQIKLESTVIFIFLIFGYFCFYIRAKCQGVH